MDKSKKRRMSILKKQNDFEEASPTETLTFKNKRRISFSGKKSVKEFCAGEYAETIWGTSYEESANSPSSKQDPPPYNTLFIDVLQNCHPLHDKQHWVYKQKKFIAQQNIASNEKENLMDICAKSEIESPQTTIEDLSLKETNKRLSCTVNCSEQNILKAIRDFDERSSITLNGSECNIVKNIRNKLKSPKKNIKDFSEFDENSIINNTDINMSIDRMNTTEGFEKIEMMIQNSQNKKSITEILIDNEIDKQDDEGLNKLRRATITKEEQLDVSSSKSELDLKKIQLCSGNLDMSIDNLLQQKRKTILLNEKLDNLAEQNKIGKSQKSQKNRQTIIANETIKPEFLQLSTNKPRDEIIEANFNSTCNNMMIDNMDKSKRGEDCNTFLNNDMNHKTSFSKNDDMDETILKLSVMKSSSAVDLIDNLSSNFKVEESFPYATDNFNDLDDTQTMLNQLDHPFKYFEDKLSTRSTTVSGNENKPVQVNKILISDALDMSIDYEVVNSNTKTVRNEREGISKVFELSIEETNNNKAEHGNAIFESIDLHEISAYDIMGNDQIKCGKTNHKRKTITNQVDVSLDEEITKSSLFSNNCVQSPYTGIVGRSSKGTKSFHKCIDKDINGKLINENGYINKSQGSISSNKTDKTVFKAEEKLEKNSFIAFDLQKEIKPSLQSVVKNISDINMEADTENVEMDIVKEENEIFEPIQKYVDIKRNNSNEITNTNLEKDLKDSFDIARNVCNMESKHITNEIFIFKTPIVYNNTFDEKIQHSKSIPKCIDSTLDFHSNNENLPIVEDNYTKNRTKKRHTINFQEEKIQNDMDISLTNDTSESIVENDQVELTKLEADSIKTENITNQKENFPCQKTTTDTVEEQTVEIDQNSIINHLSVQLGNNFCINNSSNKPTGESLLFKRFDSSEHSYYHQISENVISSVCASKPIKPEEDVNFDHNKNTEDKIQVSVIKSLKNIHKNTPPEAPSLKRCNTICSNDMLQIEENCDNLQIFRNTRKSIVFEFGKNDIIEDEKTTEIQDEIQVKCDDNISDSKQNIETLKNIRKTIIFENDHMIENKSKTFDIKSKINNQTKFTSRPFGDLELTGINALDDTIGIELQSLKKVPSDNKSNSINMEVDVHNNEKSVCDDMFVKHNKSIDDKILELSKSIHNYVAPSLDTDSSDEELSVAEEKNCKLSSLCNLPTPVINQNLNEIPKIKITNTSMILTPTKSPTLGEKSPKKEIIFSSNLCREKSPRKEILLRNSPRKLCLVTTNIIEMPNKFNDISNKFCRTLSFEEVPKKEIKKHTDSNVSKSIFNISESCNDEIEKTKMILVDSSESSIESSKMNVQNEKEILKVSCNRRSSLNPKVCSRCKRCRLSMDKTEIDNFKLEPESKEEIDFSILDKYKNYTTLQDVWRAHERRQANTYALDLNNVNCDKNSMKKDINLGKYFKNFQIENCFPMGNKFEIELKNKIPNITDTWKVKVCSYFSNNFIILTYIQCPAIELVIECTPDNFQNYDLKFSKIYTRESCIYAEESWLPNDKLIIMEFKKLIPSNETLYNKCSKLKELNDCLQFINKLVQFIICNVKKLMSVIIISKGSLERYGDKVAIHKIYYDKLSDKKTIIIEINRIKEISIKNIISPHISEFTTAAIRGFPIGIEFVEIILNDLSNYLS